MSALAGSGLATDSFRFCGFLPPKQTQRRKTLEALREESCTLIFYEAPHRLMESLADMEAIFGERPVAIARELTKIHEEFLRGTPASVRAELAGRVSLKGEITVLIGKQEDSAGTAADQAAAEQEVRALERHGMARVEAVKQVAKARGIPRRELYRRVIS
jgi:16S rRNA (cytidine1402-2'-O)-methyltransferase